MTITQTRQSVSAKLRGADLPDAFRLATSASLARILSKPVAERTVAQHRDARRIRSQEARICRGGL